MKVVRILAILFSLIGNFLSAQTGNLVSNPGFEGETSIAINSWPTENPPGTKVTNGWYTPTPATPDYWNSDRSYCDGFPIACAHTGQGRAAIICGMYQQLPGVHNYKEYLENALLEPLKSGKKYQVSFYIAHDCSSTIAGTGIGVYFSKDMLLNKTKENLAVNPQVISYRHITQKNGWVRITGTFIAEGGEQFMTIGSFTDTASLDVFSLGDSPLTTLSSPHITKHAYYYIDDVCVSLEEEDACLCKPKIDPPKQQVREPQTDYILFLLDVSNSMNEHHKLKTMKKAMKKFVDELKGDCKVGIMTFSSHTSMPLPFVSIAEEEIIMDAIDKLKGKGATNGDLALKKVVKMIDSLNIGGKCHVIMATDGIFELSKTTKALMDTCLSHNNATFNVLQFGDKKNADLEELSQGIPNGSYHMTSRDNIDAILKNEIPPEAPPAKPAELPPPVTVFYSPIPLMLNQSVLYYYLLSNPNDHFYSIPRKQ